MLVSMKKFLECSPVLLILAVAVAAPAVAATTRAPGQTYVYNVTIATDERVDASTLPGAVQAHVASTMAYAKTHPTEYVVRIGLESVAPNGSAQAHVSFTDSLLGNGAAMAQMNEFAASFTRDGQLVPAYNANRKLNPQVQMSTQDAQNAQAGMMGQTFAIFNSFANGCAQRPHIVSGDTWRVQSSDQYAMSQTFEFAATSTDAKGVAVTMKSVAQSASGGSTVTATGHYDAARGLVLDLRVQNAFSNTAPNGVSVSGTQTTEVALQP